jgi:peptidoglycan/xylan/chitin deacetylase (PgdA/CDA1 family)
VAGWRKLIAGAVIGAAGALYATNEELRKQLPQTARDLPLAVRRRFETATAAAREASARRRAEILHELEAHGGDHHAGQRVSEAPSKALQVAPSEVVPPGESNVP